MPKPAVIVVTSHVVRGSVGGRASVLALERMGFPVWSLPTVVLPWHPDHGRATRLAFDAQSFSGIVADLAGATWLDEVDAILTGYFADAGQIEPIAQLIETVKARNPRTIYLCDPIIGDSDGLFQAEPIAEAIRDRLIPLADIATPNRYELAWLGGAALESNSAIAIAGAKLGLKEVVVTSAFAPPGEIGTMVAEINAVYLATHAVFDAAPHGTGDLLAALYLGHRLDGDLPETALATATAFVFRQIELATDTMTDELPLADGQDVLVTLEDIEVTRIDQR